MKTELVSVCIPMYNNENVIERTLQSILNQTYKNIEIIIVDDCSKDQSVEKVKNFDDSRIHLFLNNENLGMSGNWNKCVSLANGKYIKFICADDILEADCLEKEYTYINQNDQIVMTINDSKLINTKDKAVGIFPRYHKKGIMDGKKLARKALIISNFFGMPSAVMFRKNIFEQVGGFDSAYHYILDYDLWIRIAGMGMVYVMPECLNQFRLRKDSNTGNVFSKDQKQYYKEHKYLVNKYKDQYMLNSFEVLLSLFSRKVRNFGYGLFMKGVVR